MNKEKASQIIAENKKSYNVIASDFNISRQYAWPEFETLLHCIEEQRNKKQETRNKIRILDIGCGNGRLFSFLYCRLCRLPGNLQYVGVDQSEELIKIAKKNNPDADFQVADVLSLPFKDGGFDAVAGIAFFHHIPSKESRLKVLKEIYHVLAPGGIVFLTNWNLWQRKMIKKYKLPILDFFFPHNNLDAGDFWINFKNEPRFYHHFGKNEIIKLCRDAGFKILKYEIGKTEKNSVIVAQK